MKLMVLCAFGVFSSLAAAEPVVKIAVREALELAFRKSGREIADKSAREAMELTLERNAAKFGDKVLSAAGDGGLELIEATAKYGDDVMQFAVEASPGARRILALNAETLLPLARRVGPEALEVEAKAPGLASKIFASFGDDAGKIIANSVPGDDLPRLLTYAEKADSQATRELLLKAYKKEGKTLFERIPAKLVLATGLTAALLYGTVIVTTPIGHTIDKNPEVVKEVLNHSINVFGIIIGLVVILLLWRFSLLPWHRKKKGTTTSTPSGASKTAGETKQ